MWFVFAFGSSLLLPVAYCLVNAYGAKNGLSATNRPLFSVTCPALRQLHHFFAKPF
jgi:hypothetical protein